MLNLKMLKSKVYGWAVWLFVVYLVFAFLCYYIFFKGDGCSKWALFSLFTFTTENMQNIWAHQITVTGFVMTIFLFFTDNANARRLGMSFKYIFYHNKVFRFGNILSLTVQSVLHLILNFVIAYILIGIDCLCLQRFMRMVFILNLATNIVCIICIMNLFVVARYKESVIYAKIRKAIYRESTICGKNRKEIYKKIRRVLYEKKKINKVEENYGKYILEELEKLERLEKLEKLKKGDCNQDTYNELKEYFDEKTLEDLKGKEAEEEVKDYSFNSNIGKKIKKNSKLDCELVLKNKEYDSYFGDSILTLFALYFTDPKEYDCILDSIAVRILQRNQTIPDNEFYEKDTLTMRLYSACFDEKCMEEDDIILFFIKYNYRQYDAELENRIKKYSNENEKLVSVKVVINN